MLRPVAVGGLLLLAACAAEAPPPAAGRADGPVLPETAAQLVGERGEDVLALFGTPAQHRTDGSAETWLYAGPGCLFDLVLYRDAGGERVGFAAMRPHSRLSERACMRELEASGAAARGG